MRKTAREIKTSISLDGEAKFKRSLASLDSELRVMNSELRKATSQYNTNSKSADGLRKQSALLSEKCKVQQNKVESLRKAVEDSSAAYNKASKYAEEMAKQHGENSKEATLAAKALEKAEKSMDGWRIKLNNAETSLSKMNVELKNFQKQNNGMIQMANSMDKLKAATSQFVQKSAAISKTQESFQKMKEKIQGVSDKLKPTQEQFKTLNAVAGTAKGVFGEVANKVSDIKKKIAPAVEKTKELSKVAGKITFKAAQVSAQAMTKTVSASAKAFAGYSTAIAGIGVAAGKWAVSMGAEFDAQMSTVRAISGATGKDLKALTEKAKEMGKATAFSATESAKALEYMAMAGWKTEDMVDGLEGVMNLAAASGEELASVSDIVTDAMTAFGMKADQSTQFADVLAAAASNANTTVGGLGESFQYVAPVAGSLGYTVQDTAVALGLMANAGIKGSQAGTALRATITNLAKPSKQVRTYMANLGVSLTDSAGKVKPMNDLLEDMRGKFNKLSEAQKAEYAAGIAGKEGMSGLLAIVNTSNADFDKLTNAILKSDGAAKEMANTRLDNLKGDITLLKSNAEGAGLALSERMSPALRSVVQSANSVITGLNDGGVGGALKALGKAIPRIAKNVGKLIKDNIPELVEGVNGVVLALANQINLSIPAITSSVLPVMLAGFTELTLGLVDMMPTLLPNIVSGSIVLLTGLIDGLNQVIERLNPIIPGIVQNICESLQRSLPTLLQGAVTLFMGMIEGLGQVIETLMPMLPQMINSIVQTLVANIPAIIKGGFDLLIGLIQGITDCVPELIDAITELIPVMTQALTDNLPALVTAGIDLIIAIVDGIPIALPELIKAIPQIFNAIVNALAEQDWLQIGIDIVGGIGAGLVEGVKAIGGSIKEMGTGLVNGVKSVLKIKSPSRVMRDQVGVFAAQGVGVGFVDEMKIETEKMKKSLPTSFNTKIKTSVQNDLQYFNSQECLQRRLGNTAGAGENNSYSRKATTVNYYFYDTVIKSDDDIDDIAYKLEVRREMAEAAVGGNA